MEAQEQNEQNELRKEESQEVFDFGTALMLLRNGNAVSRKGWNGKGICIKLQQPTHLSYMTRPYLFIDTTGLDTDNPDAPRVRVPWLASQTDILAEDWQLGPS